MIEFPYKRIYGLLGGLRVGKDTVAKYLQESRNFVSMAFADKIKEEFGISKKDFELAKITGKIDQLRQDLWDFSAKKKEKDPEYFIKGLVSDALEKEESVVITDIRTPEELSAVKNIGNMIYLVTRQLLNFSESTYIEGSKLNTKQDIESLYMRDELRVLSNHADSSYKFIYKLEKFFFKENLLDLHVFGNSKSLENYIDQFDIRENI